MITTTKSLQFFIERLFMSDFLPYPVFKKAMISIGWHGNLQQSDKQPNLVRPANLSITIEDFIDFSLQFPYVTDSQYYVVAKQGCNLRHGFCDFYNSIDPDSGLSRSAFMSICFFPRREDVVFALPKSALFNLPCELWQKSTDLPLHAWESGDNFIKNNSKIIFIDNNNNIDETITDFSLNRNNISKFILMENLLNWMKTDQGVDFHKNATIELLKDKNPKFLNSLEKGMTGKDILIEATKS